MSFNQDHSERLWKNQNFRRLLAGRIVTNAGDSLYSVAAMWLVFDLTGSTTYSGIAGFLVFIPRAFQFLTGPLVDQWSLRPLLIVTQFLQALIVLVIPIAAFLNSLTVEIILIVIPVLAMINQFVYPAQYAALPRILGEDQLTRANSAFSFAEEGTNMAFEALGGVLIGVVGAVSLFYVNSVTFAVAIILFAGIRVPTTDQNEDTPIQGDTSSYFSDLADGIHVVRGSVWTKLILAASVANFMVGVTIATLPAFAAIRGGPEIYGALFAALGAGLAIGAAVASRLTWMQFGRIKIFGFGAGFVFWIGAVYSPWVGGTIVLTNTRRS